MNSENEAWKLPAIILIYVIILTIDIFLLSTILRLGILIGIADLWKYVPVFNVTISHLAQEFFEKQSAGISHGRLH